jgi:hypothetical protein
MLSSQKFSKGSGGLHRSWNDGQLDASKMMLCSSTVMYRYSSKLADELRTKFVKNPINPIKLSV